MFYDSRWKMKDERNRGERSILGPSTSGLSFQGWQNHTEVAKLFIILDL